MTFGVRSGCEVAEDIIDDDPLTPSRACGPPLMGRVSSGECASRKELRVPGL